jgi:hypothetical protein
LVGAWDFRVRGRKLDWDVRARATRGCDSSIDRPPVHRSVSYARNTTMKFADLIAGRRKKHKLLSWVSGTMQLGLL